MKNKVILGILIVLIIGALILLLVSKSNNKDVITKDMAYNGVNNYCHEKYDWSIAKDNHSIMSVTMGEESNDDYQVIFRSYTGSFVYFYVNKTSGLTKIVEKEPNLDIENEVGTINIKDYIK